MKAVTIRDVAKRAGVGVGTVSRVLNDSPSVRDATRKRVRAAIDALNYIPNPMARRFSLGRTLSIGAIVPFFTRPAFVERLRGVEYALADSEYDLILFNVETTARRDHYFRNLSLRDRLDGLLVVSLSPRDDDTENFRQINIPVVLVDARHPRFNRVEMDDQHGGYLAAKHLIDLGHRRITFISDWLENPFNFIASRERFAGFRRALAEAAIPFASYHLQQGDYGRSAARRMARQVLQQPDRPTAILATSDTMAVGVLEAANDVGLKVPEMLSVMGYDDIEVAEYLNLTTIRQPFFVSGVEGVEMLIEAIANPSGIIRQILLPVEVIARGTTAPPPSTD